MNRLNNKDRANILKMICEGMGINAACRVSGASKNTVLKLLADVGAVSAMYLDDNIKGLKSKRVECDEIWSFCYSKQKNVAAATSAPDEAGDVWTWTAIDVDTKLIVSYLVGGRDAEYASAFMDDLRSRIDTRIQLTTDGHKAYLNAVEDAFGADVDYAQLIKVFGNAPDGGKGRYSPAECTGIKKQVISGNPDMSKVSTSYIERSNLTMRMHNRRFTRLTNGFSKKFENHLHAISLFTMHYNYCKIHKTLRVTPAMEAGLTDHIWELEEVIGLLFQNEKAKKRGSYKKDISN